MIPNENQINTNHTSKKIGKNDEKNILTNNNIMQYLNVLEVKNIKKGKRRSSIRRKRLDDEEEKR